MTNDELLTVLRNRKVELDVEAELIRVLEENAALRKQVEALGDPFNVIRVGVEAEFGTQQFTLEIPAGYESRSKRHKLIVRAEEHWPYGCGDTLAECLAACTEMWDRLEEQAKVDAEKLANELLAATEPQAVSP